MFTTSSPQIELKKIPPCYWAYSWELPYFYYSAEKETQLIVNYLDPCLYASRLVYQLGSNEGKYQPEPVLPNDEDISAYILTEWLNAGWCPAVDLPGYTSS
jgi:hypothetical protein